MDVQAYKRHNNIQNIYTQSHNLQTLWSLRDTQSVSVSTDTHPHTHTYRLVKLPITAESYRTATRRIGLSLPGVRPRLKNGERPEAEEDKNERVSRWKMEGETQRQRDEPLRQGLWGKICLKLKHLEQRRIVAKQPGWNKVTGATGMTRSLTREMDLPSSSTATNTHLHPNLCFCCFRGSPDKHKQTEGSLGTELESSF